MNFAPGREGWAESRLRLCRGTDDSWVADVGGRGLSASSDPSGLVAGGLRAVTVFVDLGYEGGYNSGYRQKADSLGMVKRLKRSFYLKVCFLCSVVVGSALEPQAFAESVPDRGRFSALLLGSQGEPLSDVLVALVAESLDEARLPMLCKSNSAGRIMLENLQSGTYRLSVRTGRYRAPGERYIEVAPNATTVVTLVLQELLMLGDERVNVGVKPLLRNVDQRRLILRVEPSAGDVAPEDGRPDVGGGVVEVLASTQADDLGLAGLGTAGDGPVTSFGTVLNRSGIGKSLLAGQWGSGDDSFWRLKNVVEWDVGSSRTFHFSLGYGQLSFGPRGVRRTLAAGPKETEAEAEAAPFASGTSRLLSVAFEDNWQLGRVVTLTWGVELDRVDVGESHTFVSPEVGVEYVLSDSTNLFGRLSGSRPAKASTVQLTTGERVNLSSPVRVAEIDGRLEVDRGKYASAGVCHELPGAAALEVAAFHDRVPRPLAVIETLSPTWEGGSWLAAAEDSTVRGLRFVGRRHFGDRVRAEVAFVRASAPAMPERVRDVGPMLPSSLRRFSKLSATMEADIPESQTRITAVVTWMPGDNALAIVDAVSNVYDVGNEGVSFFVRQLIPLPDDGVKIFGLEFLAARQLELLFDVRNLLGEDQRLMTTPRGEYSMLQSPRSVRCGLAVRF